MPVPVKETVDLHYMDRFDRKTGTLQVKISTVGVVFSGLDDETLTSGTVALYIGRPGRDYLVMAVQEDPDGYQIKKNARGARCCCNCFTRKLIERGVELPQAADLEYDSIANAFVARLKLIVDTAEQPKEARKPRKNADKQGVCAG